MEEKQNQVVRHSLISRVFHWLMAACILVLLATGLLPVFGVPLPLISYGGTSMVTLMIGFGMLMSIHQHKKMMSR